MKFVKLANFGILEDFCVLYVIKYTRFDKLSYMVFLKIFACYTT